MKPDRVLQLLGTASRGLGGDVGSSLGALLDSVAELVATRGIDDATARIRQLLANPPHKANLDRMEEALRRREAEEAEREEE